VNIKNGIDRPVAQPNAWIADWNDPQPQLNIQWNTPQTIRSISLFFDTDFDHPMESVLMGHPESVMPFCVRNYKIMDDKGNIVFEKQGNYQTHNLIELPEQISTTSLHLMVEHPSAEVPAAVFSVRCYC
ncbi:MAG: FAD-binding dehydrogenase, partial [Chitinophagaceae bacterium]|nr:FAD-binding dehydrogenase [Chitinophagaceae bacterium]